MNSDDNGCINKPHSQGEYCPICHYRDGNGQIKNVVEIAKEKIKESLEEKRRQLIRDGKL